jgi:hypothetical protein
MPSSIEGIRCPITGKFTTSCGQCSLFKSRPGEEKPKCRAKKGEKYKMASRPGSGEYWDTYVMTLQEVKDADASRGMDFKVVKAKGGA